MRCLAPSFIELALPGQAGGVLDGSPREALHQKAVRVQSVRNCNNLRVRYTLIILKPKRLIGKPELRLQSSIASCT